ncbi:MAG TPA: hypothetical protein VF571_09280 [Pyrinomonadaceae bacterium]|jgi:hypothetical protein
MKYINLCGLCGHWIPQGYVIYWQQHRYHPICAIQVAITDTERKNQMNCKYCENHILATTQVMWKGYPFHEDCLVKAIQEANQPPAEEMNQAAELMDDFDHDTFYPEGDEDFADDELSPAFEIQEPEYANGIAEIPNNQSTVVVTPEVMIHPPAGNGQIATVPNVGNLMLGTKGSRFINRSELFNLETPPATSTWQPVAHSDFVRKLLDGLWERRLSVLDEKYAVSADGFKLYGLITLYDEYAGVNYAVGLRNSNDKSTRLSLAVGYVVKVCTNGMVHGEYQPLTAKHTAKFNLDDSLCLGIDRIKRSFLGLSGAIDRKREISLTEGRAQELVYKAFMQYKLPVSLLNTVHKELFISPSYEEFKPLNLWSLENSFTTAFKKLQPTSQFEATAKLAKFIDTTLN